MNAYWNDFHMSREDWDEGFGYDTPCDNDRPLRRTFNALHALAYAVSDTAVHFPDEYDEDQGIWSYTLDKGDMIRWGYNYARNNIDELKARCLGDNAGANAHTHYCSIDNYTELYMNFFYKENVISRASTLMHETRHADCSILETHGHTGAGSANQCPRKASCDANFFEPEFVNSTQVIWLWQFAEKADRWGLGFRHMAADHANTIIERAYDTRPSFHVRDPDTERLAGENCDNTDHTCVTGYTCQNRMSRCIACTAGGDACDASRQCCDGYTCDASTAVCTRCTTEGNPCDAVGCCQGLFCDPTTLTCFK
jgi:hypothetical protein